MPSVQQLSAFVRIAQTGSLTQSARSLGVTQSTVSKWLAALEHELGVTLVHRTTRSVRLTEAGERFLGHAQTATSAWENGRDAATSEQPHLSGPIRLSVPAVFGNRHVVPVLASFLHENPDVALDLHLSDRYVNLVDEGYHLAIRVGRPVDSSHRARRIGGTPRRLVSAPGLSVAEPQALTDAHCLVHTGVERTVWTFERERKSVRVPVTGRVRADHSDALRQFAVDGLGFALLAEWLVREDLDAGRLVAHLQGWSTTPAPIRAVLPPRRAVPARVRALLTHIESAWSAGQASPIG